MHLVLFEFVPDQKLEVTQDSSLKCLGQPAKKMRVQPVGAIFQLAFHQSVSIQCCVSATSSRKSPSCQVLSAERKEMVKHLR